MKRYLPDMFRSRVLLPPQTTAAAAIACAQPTPGVIAITLRGIALMGNAADLTLSLVSADDAIGTNPVAFPVNVPIFVNGVRATDAKEKAVTVANGNHIVDFCVDPATIPAGKFIGLSYANSNAANLLTTVMVEETTVSNTAS